MLDMLGGLCYYKSCAARDYTVTDAERYLI
jgi:hypothetical protein